MGGSSQMSSDEIPERLYRHVMKHGLPVANTERKSPDDIEYRRVTPARGAGSEPPDSLYVEPKVEGFHQRVHDQPFEGAIEYRRVTGAGSEADAMNDDTITTTEEEAE